MEKRTAIADGQIEAHQKATKFANDVQDAVNITAIVGAFHRHLQALREAGCGGDELNNHPMTLAFTSKLNSLCRLDTMREANAFNACDRVAQGESVEYEVIPL